MSMILHTVHCTRHPAYGKWVWSGVMGGWDKAKLPLIKKKKEEFILYFQKQTKKLPMG